MLKERRYFFGYIIVWTGRRTWSGQLALMLHLIIILQLKHTPCLAYGRRDPCRGPPGCAEKSGDTLCVPSWQKCAHVLQCARNVRNAARVRMRPAEWVVCMGARVRGALVLLFASAQGGLA